MNLWGNKCDLSLSLGTVDNSKHETLAIKELESNILCDQSEDVWRVISDFNNKSQILGKIM